MKTIAIVAGVVKNNNKYLLLKRHNNHRYSPNEWEYISGTFDTKETGEEIVVREVLEEANLNSKILNSGKVLEIVEEDIRWVVCPYLLESSSTNVTISDEHNEFCWIKKDEIQSLCQHNEFDFLSQVLSNLGQ